MSRIPRISLCRQCVSRIPRISLCQCVSRISLCQCVSRIPRISLKNQYCSSLCLNFSEKQILLEPFFARRRKFRDCLEVGGSKGTIISRPFGHQGRARWVFLQLEALPRAWLQIPSQSAPWLGKPEMIGEHQTLAQYELKISAVS